MARLFKERGGKELHEWQERLALYVQLLLRARERAFVAGCQLWDVSGGGKCRLCFCSEGFCCRRMFLDVLSRLRETQRSNLDLMCVACEDLHDLYFRGVNSWFLINHCMGKQYMPVCWRRYKYDNKLCEERITYIDEIVYICGLSNISKGGGLITLRMWNIRV